LLWVAVGAGALAAEGSLAVRPGMAADFTEAVWDMADSKVTSKIAFRLCRDAFNDRLWRRCGVDSTQRESRRSKKIP
jgi:hypothetical protein